MSFIYCTRRDKNGNMLTTSYTNEKTAEKYGGVNSKRWEGERRIALDTTSDDASPLIVRSKLVSSVAAVKTYGPYGIYIVDDGTLTLINSFSSYGEANSYMKTMASVYPELYVIFDENYKVAETSDESDSPW